MPAAVTVWAVELDGRSSLDEVRGSLTLASDALVFTPRDAGRAERRIPLREVSRARRLRGSPVLMVVCEGPESVTRTAFYFVQPPPLEQPDEPLRPTLAPIVRNSRRKGRRQNVGYLGAWNREKKALLREWERQVKAAAAAARS